MCLSRIGQIGYGALSLISVGLILGSVFTPGDPKNTINDRIVLFLAWRQVSNNIQQGQLSQLPPLNMGLFAFACQRSNTNNYYQGNVANGQYGNTYGLG
jgi:hypothetical protein